MDILLSGVRETPILEELGHGPGLRFNGENVIRKRAVVGSALDVNVAALERIDEFEESGSFETPEAINMRFLWEDHAGSPLGI